MTARRDPLIASRGTRLALVAMAVAYLALILILPLVTVFSQALARGFATFVSALQEIRNHKAAYDLVREEAKAKKLRINLTLVRRLYDMLVAGFDATVESVKPVGEGTRS